MVQASVNLARERVAFLTTMNLVMSSFDVIKEDFTQGGRGEAPVSVLSGTVSRGRRLISGNEEGA
jgi:hypothetical protein